MKLNKLLRIGRWLGLGCIVTASQLLFLTWACTPMEREIAEEVLHEASVAEQAIEADLEGKVYTPQQGATAEKPIVMPKNTITLYSSKWPRGMQSCNNRQYPKRPKKLKPRCDSERS